MWPIVEMDNYIIIHVPDKKAERDHGCNKESEKDHQEKYVTIRECLSKLYENNIII